MSGHRATPPGRAIGVGSAAAAVVLLSLNLRPVMSSIPPLTPDIQSSTGWSHAMMGLITTLPIVCMAGFAPLVPRWAARWGRTPVTASALVLVVVATAARVFSGSAPWLLPVTAVLAGIAIATGSGLVPALIREWFPDRIGPLAGVYTGSMIFGAALGAAISVPLMNLTGSWPDALALWSLLAAAGALVWLLIALRHREAERHARVTAPSIPRHLPWRSGLAWWLAGFLGCNGFVFYSQLAWLAPSYDERGWTQAEAGFLLAFCTAVQMVAALVLPRIAPRFPYRRALLAVSPVACVIGILMMGFIPHTLTLVAITINGIGLGGGFALGIMVMTEYSSTPADAARITGMIFLLMYIPSAVAPFLTGAIFGLLPSWEVFYLILLAVVLLQFIAVLPLRRDRVIA